ncbi:MAG TPA: glycoside hydrolase family 97 protein [Longimicrobium sp.]|uniref:glycoside hydrolase family 97 protein n=1 Tax=Longimicrobium sp. TaxID=2029185 RepID=UPI002ED8E436
MLQRRLRSLVRPLALGMALFAAPAGAQEELRVSSPDARNTVTVGVREGRLWYAVQRGGRPVLLPSRLGFAFAGADTLRDSLRITGSARDSADESWTQPWGEVARVRDHHNELRVHVAEGRAPGRRFDVVFRAFDDGVAFRYELGERFGGFVMMEELTEFALADNGRAWWIPGNQPEPDRQEILYSSSPVSRVDTAHTPFTVQMTDGTQVVIHEANLVDYAGMYLARTSNRTLQSTLARWADGVAVRGSGPFVTPWRTIQLADRPEDLHPSLLTLKLNPPSRIADTRWITPMKYNGVWWGMHINTETWGQGPIHGARTDNVRRYLDFAAANGLGGTLVEGWNLGWDEDWFNTMQATFSFTQAYPDFDLPGLAAYARERGMTLIGHHETATKIDNYERQLDSAMALYERVGVRAVKTGYVGDRTEHGHAHQSQFMVRHHRRVIETAARHGIMVNVHEPIKDTGERRTWPNMLSREGSRGMEYNAWGGEGGNPPEHETILFFTRMLSGPMDFTPGIFDILIQRPTGTPRRPDESRPRTTLAKQLALYVVLYSPLQMAADLPENYEGQPAFQFIRDVAVDWDTTIVLDGQIGDHVIVARKQKARDAWFLGAITDEEARTFDVPLSFLPAGRAYVAEIYADGPGADWRDNPLPVAIRRQNVDAGTTLRIEMAPGGGQAVRIRPAP